MARSLRLARSGGASSLLSSAVSVPPAPPKPDLSHLPGLEVDIKGADQLQPWKDGGFKACSKYDHIINAVRAGPDAWILDDAAWGTVPIATKLTLNQEGISPEAKDLRQQLLAGVAASSSSAVKAGSMLSDVAMVHSASQSRAQGLCIVCMKELLRKVSDKITDAQDLGIIQASHLA